MNSGSSKKFPEISETEDEKENLSMKLTVNPFSSLLRTNLVLELGPSARVIYTC